MQKGIIKNFIILIIFVFSVTFSSRIYAVHHSTVQDDGGNHEINGTRVSTLTDFMEEHNIGGANGITSREILNRLNSLNLTAEQKYQVARYALHEMERANTCSTAEEKKASLRNSFAILIPNANYSMYLYYGYILGSRISIIQASENGYGTDSTYNEEFRNRVEEYNNSGESNRANRYTSIQCYYDLTNLLSQILDWHNITVEGGYTNTIRALESNISGENSGTISTEGNSDDIREEQGQGSGELLGDPTAANAHHTIGEITGEAQSFINTGNGQSVGFNANNLQNGSNTLFNILLGIGLAAAVIIGAYLGVKFMLASAEDKAKVKESLVPYFAGCIIIFGAFTIWKLAVVLLSGLE